MHLLAQIRNPVLPAIIGGGENPDVSKGGTALGKLVSNVLSGLFIAAFLLAFVYLILGAVTWITSGGDKANLEKARNQITNAIVGIVIVAAAWAIMALAGTFLGIPSLENMTIPTITGN